MARKKKKYEKIECQACGVKTEPKVGEVCRCKGCGAVLTTDQ